LLLHCASRWLKHQCLQVSIVAYLRRMNITESGVFGYPRMVRCVSCMMKDASWSYSAVTCRVLAVQLALDLQCHVNLASVCTVRALTWHTYACTHYVLSRIYLYYRSILLTGYFSSGYRCWHYKSQYIFAMPHRSFLVPRYSLKTVSIREIKLRHKAESEDREYEITTVNYVLGED